MDFKANERVAITSGKHRGRSGRVWYYDRSARRVYVIPDGGGMISAKDAFVTRAI